MREGVRHQIGYYLTSVLALGALIDVSDYPDNSGNPVREITLLRNLSVGTLVGVREIGGTASYRNELATQERVSARNYWQVVLRARACLFVFGSRILGIWIIRMTVSPPIRERRTAAVLSALPRELPGRGRLPKAGEAQYRYQLGPPGPPSIREGSKPPRRGGVF